MTTSQTDEVADEFSRLIRDRIGPEGMDDVITRNRKNAVATCATRRHCEATITMAGAFTLICGRAPDLVTPADAKLWSDAWAIARRNRFPRRIYQTKNDAGQCVYAFKIKDAWIADPRLSECGRFKVDPELRYGLRAGEVFTFDVAKSWSSAVLDPRTLVAQEWTAATEPVRTIRLICEQYPELSGVRHGDSFALTHRCEGGGHLFITVCEKSRVGHAHSAEVGVERFASNNVCVETRTTVPIESLAEWIDQALARANDPTNVGDYFLKRLGCTHPDADLYKLPLATPCGEACVGAIEAGYGLIAEIRAAVGDDWDEIDKVIHVVQKVVAVYWRG